jgi:pimeloyl-ACP methyl ester carboxylesterase
MASSLLAARRVRTSRHATHYWESGPSTGPLMIFLHGWPGIGLMWRAQMEAFAAEGWHCVAPDMRGYGDSSRPSASEAYALQQIVDDMVELHEHLGSTPAVWVGHDLGSPVAGALAAHQPKRVSGLVLCSVPYFPDAFALKSVLPLVDRSLYPADQYPDGQWSYYRFYQNHFEQSVVDFDADISSSLAAIYRRGDPDTVGKVYRSALVAQRGGWFATAHRAPLVVPDTALWPTPDFAVLVDAFRKTGFRPANAWYLNDRANIAYAHEAPDGGRLHQPVLFINSDLDGLCDITRSRLGDPMKAACTNLTITGLKTGHWLPLERKNELVQSIRSWVSTKRA